MSKHPLRALGLSLLAALGLMAFAAAGGQAANLTSAAWTKSKILIEGLQLKATVTGSAETASTLLVPNLGIEISCPKFSMVSGTVNPTAAIGHGEVDLLFEECQVYSIEKALPFNLTSQTPLPCLPLDSVSGKDGHIRAKALLLSILHEGKNYLIAESLNLTEGAVLSEIKFSPETGCPVPLKPKVTGEVAFLINKGDLGAGQPAETAILISGGDHKVLQELFGIKLLYGSNEAFIDGSSSLSLTGAHGGKTWGVDGADVVNLVPTAWTKSKILIEGLQLKATSTGSAESASTLLVPILGIEISCPKFSVLSSVVNPTAAVGHGEAELLFEECKVYSIEKALPFNLTSQTPLPCLPLDSVSGKDGHIRAKALLLSVLHEGKNYLIAESLNLTGPLATIKYSSETGCPIPLKQEVFGEVAFFINKGDLGAGQPAETAILISDGDHKVLQELFGIKLLYGTHEAFIDGSSNITLTGAHAGKTWGVDGVDAVPGGWFVLGNSSVSALVTGEAEGAGRLLVPNLGLEINCPKFTVLNASISNSPSLGHGVAAVLFEECKIFSMEKVVPFNLTSQIPLPCLPLDSVTGKDGHIRAEALVLLVLHKGKDYLVFEPLNLEAGPLAVIKYSQGTGCPIPLKSEVLGQYAFEINTGDKHAGLEVIEPLITAGNHKTLQELLGLKLNYINITNAFLDGSAKLKLTGAHAGCSWGVL